jgi:hypothetical protein
MSEYINREFFYKRNVGGIPYLIISIFLFIISIVSVALIIKREVIIEEYAEVSVGDKSQLVQSVSPLSIERNYLQEGKIVHKGDILVEYNNEELTTKMNAINDEISNIEGKLKELDLFYNSVEEGVSKFESEDHWGYSAQFEDYLLQVEYNINVDNKNNKEVIQQNSVNRKKAKYLQDKISKIDEELLIKNEEINKLENEEKKAILLKQVRELEDLKKEMQINKNEIYEHELTEMSAIENKKLKQQVIVQILKEIKDNEQNLMQLKNQLTELKALEKKNYIKADIDGVVHLKSEINKLGIIPVGEIIAEIVPDIKKLNEISIVTYISPESASSIEVGQEAIFKNIRNKAKDFEIIGKVETVDYIVTEINGQKFLRVELKASMKENQNDNIRYGLAGKVKFIVDRKSYFEYYYDLLFHNN